MCETTDPQVSSELRSMVNEESKATPNPAVRLNKILAFSSVAMGAVVVCLSVAVARMSASTGKETRPNGIDYPRQPPAGLNSCEGKKVKLENIQCVEEGFDVDPSRFALGTAEQSGVNVTLGYQGDLDVDTVPIAGPY